ncbi:hypothetical protein GCM10027612_49480 [Microbispora bryophytorum subsp. camponoti]
MDVICALVGIPEQDRPRWREWGATVAAGAGQDFARAIPGIMAGAADAVAAARAGHSGHSDKPGECRASCWASWCASRPKTGTG